MKSLLFKRIVIGVDPALCHQSYNDETGIAVVGLGLDNYSYVLEDLSGHFTPAEWARVVKRAYDYFNADVVVAEVNAGGSMVEHTLRTIDPSIRFKAVRARQGKSRRAEPIVSLYEQSKIFHLKTLPLLEEQMCSYVPFKSNFSPDRMDALVWALTELTSTPRPRLRKVWSVG